MSINKLNKIVIIPKWKIILFSLFFVGFLISIGLNFYLFQNSKKIELKRNKLQNHIQQFFEENTSALKQYEEWKSNN